jgi:hypothetical protein
MSFDYDDEEWAETLRWWREALQKYRGYAAYWAVDPKRAEEHAAEVLHNYLVQIGQAPSASLSRGGEPPDMVLLAEGANRRIGIEITELVDFTIINRHHKRKQRGEVPIFEVTNWTPDTIAVSLCERIAAKDDKLRNAAPRYDEILLAIVTDEPMIDETCARAAVTLRRCQRTLNGHSSSSAITRRSTRVPTPTSAL